MAIVLYFIALALVGMVVIFFWLVVIGLKMIALGFSLIFVAIDRAVDRRRARLSTEPQAKWSNRR